MKMSSIVVLILLKFLLNHYLPQAPRSLVICAVDFPYYNNEGVKVVIFMVMDFLKNEQYRFY